MRSRVHLLGHTPVSLAHYGANARHDVPFASVARNEAEPPPPDVALVQGGVTRTDAPFEGQEEVRGLYNLDIGPANGSVATGPKLRVAAYAPGRHDVLAYQRGMDRTGIHFGARAVWGHDQGEDPAH